MGEQNSGKLNRLLASLGDTGLVSSRRLRTLGYQSSLVSRYVASGWLVSLPGGCISVRGLICSGRAW